MITAKITECDNGYIFEYEDEALLPESVLLSFEGRERALCNCIFELVDKLYPDTVKVNFEVIDKGLE